MKTVKRVIVLLVCFVLLSNCFTVSAANHIDSSLIPQMFYSTMDPYGVSLMDVSYYSWYPSDEFYITDKMLKSEDFLFYEDLPYGMDTVVVGLYFGTAASIFFFVNGADSTKPTVQQNYNSSGNCLIYIMSLSPIYRIGYNHNTGQTISFNGVSGLTSSNNTSTTVNGVKYFGYNYSMANDVYMTVSSNANLAYFEMYLNGVIGAAEYGVDSYPKKSDIEFQLQQEQNETTKGIWETLKSIPSQIGAFFDNLKNYLLYFQATEPEHVNPFSGILSSVQNFFDNEMSSTEDFKTSLQNTASNVTGYLTQGTLVIQRLLNGVPILNGVLIFLVAFAVVRKVVGR